MWLICHQNIYVIICTEFKHVEGHNVNDMLPSKYDYYTYIKKLFIPTQVQLVYFHERCKGEMGFS